MSVSLRKPSHATVFLGTQNGGDHDLKITGSVVHRGAQTIKIKVDRVTGASGRDYTPTLKGSKIELPLATACLF